MDSYNGKVALSRVYLNSSGYDSFGSYFGSGPPLYYWSIVDSHLASDLSLMLLDGTLRAGSRASAKAKVRAMPFMKDCKFYN